MFDSHDDDFVLNGFLVGLVVYIFCKLCGL